MPGEFAKLFVIISTAWFLEREAGSDQIGDQGDTASGRHCRGIWSFDRQAAESFDGDHSVRCGGLHDAGGRHEVALCVGTAALGGAGILSILLFMKDTYWYQRMTSFVDPFQDPLGEGYQAVQSLLALGSGGLFGVGLGKSVQKNLYLPEPQNDFILAIIGEELGFIGIVLVLALYCCFLWRGVHVAINAPDQFGMLLASGIVLMVGIQVILNIAVVTSSMPPTGINLPFISYGGNALLMFMFSAGVLLNISRHAPKNTGVE